MNPEPSQLIRGMDVDIGMGLGDDLGGFEGFDTMFAEPTNTTDFFNFCALEEGQQEQDAATTSAFSSPPSPVGAFGQQQRGSDFAQESWNTGGQQQIQAWPSLTLSSSDASRNPNVLLQGGGKPRARKRHDEDEALEAAEEAFPMMKVRSVRSVRSVRVRRVFHLFPDFVARHVRSEFSLPQTQGENTHTHGAFIQAHFFLAQQASAKKRANASTFESPLSRSSPAPRACPRFVFALRSVAHRRLR